MKLSIVIPCKHESYLPTLLRDLSLQFHHIDYEVLVQTEPGFTNAIWHGVQRATGDFVAIMDADGKHQPFDVEEMLYTLEQHLNDCDLVLAYRQSNKYPWHRRQISRLFKWLAQKVINLPYEDPLSTFLVAKRGALRFQNSSGSKFIMDVLAHLDSNRVIEYAVDHTPPPNHQSHMRLTDGLQFFWQLMELKWRLIRS